MADFLVYWLPSRVEAADHPLRHVASGQLGRVDPGDILWVVTIKDGRLILVLRFPVGRVVGEDEARRLLGTSDFRQAKLHAISTRKQLIDLREVDITDVALSLRFKGAKDRLPIRYSGQHLQTLRRLKDGSSRLLQQAWDRTPRGPANGPGRHRDKELTRVLFVRVGWMLRYAGPAPDDPKPIGGGSYTQDKLGHEAYNFEVYRGRLYGYYQSASDQTTLERIDPAGVGADALQDVTVIFVARNPSGGGQVIVGWYRNATVYRHVQPKTPGRASGFGHHCVATASDGVLVPVPNRTFSVVGGKGGFGQTNLCYPREANGKSKQASWMKDALTYVESYTASNALREPEATADEAVIQTLEQAESRAQGQGFARTAAERKALEDLGMKRAEQYFLNDGWRVEDVHKTQSYDLHCTKGHESLLVEVKATMSLGETVFIPCGSSAERRVEGPPKSSCRGDLETRPDGRRVFVQGSIGARCQCSHLEPRDRDDGGRTSWDARSRVVNSTTDCSLPERASTDTDRQRGHRASA